MTDPKISIITVCFNAEAFIESAIKSVVGQSYKNIEYIIVDGASTDDTLNIINKYKGRIHNVISGKDKGIYDAMNKGISCSSGEVLYFLNADDSFHDDKVVEYAANEFSSNPGIDILYGNVHYVNTTSEQDMINYNAYPKRDNKKIINFLKTAGPQQCAFVKRSLFDKHGAFSDELKVHGDFDWMLRCLKDNSVFSFTDRVFANYNAQGLSYKIYSKVFSEKLKVILKGTGLKNTLLYLVFVIVRRFKRAMKRSLYKKAKK